MQNIIDVFVKSIETQNSDLLPLASSYKATENGTPSALCHMEAYRLLDKVNCVGTSAYDPFRNTIYLVINAAEGSSDVVLSTRLKLAEEKITEIELVIYRSRSDTGFWFGPQEVEKHQPKWDYVVPKEQRASREELEQLAKVLYDNTLDGGAYDRDDECVLMETGGVVMENAGYNRLITPDLPEDFPEGDVRLPIPFGIGSHRPMGDDVRVFAIDEEKGLVAVVGYVDGVVSPYVVSDETSSCFVPMPMIGTHRKSLLPELCNDKNLVEEMKATGETITIVKYYNNKLYLVTQNIKMKSYGSRSCWRDEVMNTK